MKTKHHIEDQFKKLKPSYKVPDGYFDNFKPAKAKPANIIRIKMDKRLWIVAASFLILVSIGYKIMHWQEKEQHILKIEQFQTNTNTQSLFDDLTDDEIIEYLTEENLSEQTLDY